MKWCEQCEREVGYVEQQVADDPHGLEYHELRCEECGGSLALAVVEVEPSGLDGGNPTQQDIDAALDAKRDDDEIERARLR